MGLQVSSTSPGWPQPHTTTPEFAAIAWPANNRSISSIDLPGSGPGRGRNIDPSDQDDLPGQGDVIDTSTFTVSDVDETECELPPYEPVYPPGEEPPEYGPEPGGWNPPSVIDDPVEPIIPVVDITVTGDDLTVCIHQAGATIPVTQTVDPPEYAGLFDPPTSNYDGNVGTYPVVPGEFHDPDDGTIYRVTSRNGTLTVDYCDPDYDILCDCSLVAEGGYRDAEDRYYRTDANYIRYDLSVPYPAELSPIHSLLAVAVKLVYRGQEEDPYEMKNFTITVYDEHDDLVETVYTSGNSSDVTTVYLTESILNLDEADVTAVIDAYQTNGDWSQSKPYRIVVEETDSPYHFKKTFYRNYINAKCPLHTRTYRRCTHRWVTTANPTDLWAGTAVPG